MRIDDFRKMYLTELQELRSVEKQLTKALPELAAVAGEEVRALLDAQSEQARSYVERLDRIIDTHNGELSLHVDQSMSAMLREANKWAGMVEDQTLRDAGLIASAQRVKHYQIAVYGTLAAWAKQLGFDEELDALLDILEEQKRADEQLSTLAKGPINQEAAVV